MNKSGKGEFCAFFPFSSVSGCQFKRAILAFSFFFPKLLEEIFEFGIDEYK